MNANKLFDSLVAEGNTPDAAAAAMATALGRIDATRALYHPRQHPEVLEREQEREWRQSRRDDAKADPKLGANL